MLIRSTGTCKGSKELCVNRLVCLIEFTYVKLIHDVFNEIEPLASNNKISIEFYRYFLLTFLLVFNVLCSFA